MNRTDLGSLGYRIADYTYDDATGAVKKARYFVKSDACGQSFVADSISYTYDSGQNRLTGIHSSFFDFDLYYDAQNPTGSLILPTKRVEYDEKWNGGINGWRAQWKLPLNSGITGFDDPTWYGFKYDGLNRLTQADATIEENAFAPLGASFDHNSTAGGVFPRITKAWMGDAQFEYDVVGNLIGLRRYCYDGPGIPPAGLGESWLYQYTPGTNRLSKLNGAASPTVDFGYDLNGNLNLETQRNLSSFLYNHANLPVTMTIGSDAADYHYSAAGERVWKSVTDAAGEILHEYYLRDASGRVLAVVNEGTQNVDFELYGNGLIAEWTRLDSIAEDSSSGSGPGGNGSTKSPEGERKKGKRRFPASQNRR